MEAKTPNARDNKTETFDKTELVQLLKLGHACREEFEARDVEFDASAYDEFDLTAVIDHRRDHETGLLKLMNGLTNEGEREAEDEKVTA